MLTTIARRSAKKKEPVIISPLAREAVEKIDALFRIERAINGSLPDERLAIRQTLSRPLVDELEVWMRATHDQLSRHDPVAKAIRYMLKVWADFARFLDDGRICLTNNAAERALDIPRSRTITADVTDRSRAAQLADRSVTAFQASRARAAACL